MDPYEKLLSPRRTTRRSARLKGSSTLSIAAAGAIKPSTNIPQKGKDADTSGSKG